MRQSVARTILNAWTTKHRLHTDVIPACLLSCGGASCDTLSQSSAQLARRVATCR